MFKKQSLFLALILLFAACAPTPQPTPDNIIVPAPTEASTQAPTAQAETCPAATADLKLMVNTENGYCLLYPAEFTWDGSRMIILNPIGIGTPGDFPGEVWLVVSISEAIGQTAAQAADARFAEIMGNADLSGYNITRTEIIMDGKQAVLMDGLPGQNANRLIFIVNDDRLYQFYFAPWYPKDGTTPLEKLYQIIIDSFHFLP